MKVYEEHHIDSLGQDIRGVLQDHWCSGSKILIEECSTFCIPFSKSLDLVGCQDVKKG